MHKAVQEKNNEKSFLSASSKCNFIKFTIFYMVTHITSLPHKNSGQVGLKDSESKTNQNN
jgi:hypothetical protein